MGVPKSYLTAEEDLSGKSTLAQEDIKFARTIQRIQKIIISELAKISLIHLYLRGYDEASVYNFDLKLTNPSTVTEMMQLDLMDKRFGAARDIADSELISNEYVQKSILKLSDSDIASIKIDRQKEASEKFIVDQLEQGESAVGGGEEGLPPAPPASNEDDDNSSNETKVQKRNKSREIAKDMMPYDPTGTRELPGYPKDYTYNETGITSRAKKKKQRPDILDKTISDIMKFNTESNNMLESLNRDNSEEKLDKSTLKSIVSNL